MTITADYQFDARSVTLGGSNSYELLSHGGVFAVQVKSYDAERVMADGAVAGRDVLRSKFVVLNIEVNGTTEALSGSAMESLITAWAPASSGEVTLDVRLPGSTETTVRFYGRPDGVRAAAFTIQDQLSKSIRATCAFRALDPLRYGAAVTGSATTNQTVANAGAATTDRSTIVVIGNGGTPVLTNTTDSSGYVSWSSTLASGASRTLDLRARTLVDDLGVSCISELLNASTWFRWLSGNNSLTVTGCTSAQVTLRPAWF